MPEQTQTQSFLSIEGLQAYGIVLTEQQYLTLCGLVDNYAASAIAQVANAASSATTAINTTKQQAISHIDQYAPMVICTEGEYPAQPVAGTMYFRFPNE